MKKLLLFSLLLFLCVQVQAQSIGEKLTAFSEQLQTEKVYFSHDKPYYAPGETIWGKVYLVDGSTHQPYAATPVVYVDWVKPDGTIKTSYTLQIKEGSAPLDIPTTLRDTTGVWNIRAYSQYQRNFDDAYLFQKEIRLLDQQVDDEDTARDSIEDFTVRLFPEGGHLVAGLESTVAFQARNGKGENISVSGLLEDERGTRIVDFLSLNEGMGMFKIRPEAGKTYILKARYRGTEREFPLPKALPEGIILKASSRAADQIRVSLKSNLSDGLGGASLVGHVRGQVFLEQELPNEPQFTVHLPKSTIPSGILHFTVFDREERPVGERLVFNKQPAAATIVAAKMDADTYGKRTPVTIEITPANDTEALQTNLSVSVYNQDAMQESMNRLTIENYLLLQADLRGKINNIQQYFTSNDSKTNTLLDLLLLTHGWRKFNWQDVLTGTSPALIYGREASLSVAGKITKFEQDKPIQAAVQLHVMDPAFFTSAEITTAEDGVFFFKGFEFTDTVDIVLQASTFNARQKQKIKDGEMRRTGNRYVDVHLLDLNEYPYNPEISFPSRIYQPQALKRYAFTVANEIASNSADGFPWTIDLQEVTVTTGLNKATLREKEIERRYDEKGVFYFGGTPKFRADDPEFDGFRDGHIYELISKILPTATFTRRGGKPTLILGSLSAGQSPIIVLDGQILTEAAINNINPDDIAVVDVLEGLFSLHYSNDSTVIQLVSKDPSEIKRPNPGMKSIRHPGFYQARTFYSPDYATLSTDNDAGDYRTTLFWDPEVKLAASAKSLSFYTGDKPGSYLVWIEGLREDGIPFTQKLSFRVE